MTSGASAMRLRSVTTPSTRRPVRQLPEASIGAARVHASAMRRPRRSSRARSRSGPSPCGSWRRPGSRGARSICSRIVRGCHRLPLSSSGGTSGGGGGGGVPSRFSRIHLPRTTGDVRSACDVTVRMLPCPSRPLPRSSVSVTRRKWLPRHARDAVVPAPAARSRRCSRRVSRSSTLRSSRMMLSKNSSVSRWNACRRLSSKSGNSSEFGHARSAGCAAAATGRRNC